MSSLDTYDHRKAIGVCTRCGHWHRNATQMCRPCAEINRERARASMHKRYARNIARYGRARGSK